MQDALHVVVVDDEDLVRDVIAQLLIKEGHTVKQCASGAEAIAYLTSNSADLLFTDLSMPRMNGVQLIDELLKRNLFSKDRIVAVTGLSFESPDVHYVTARKIFVLFKPFDSAALRWSLETLLTEA